MVYGVAVVEKPEPTIIDKNQILYRIHTCLSNFNRLDGLINCIELNLSSSRISQEAKTYAENILNKITVAQKTMPDSEIIENILKELNEIDLDFERAAYIDKG